MRIKIMRANLIYNPNSGLLNDVQPEDLQLALSQAGYEPIYSLTNKEEDLDPIIAGAEGLLVVAGGDGSVRSIVTRNLERKLPIAIIPMGTANNIARMYGITGKPLEVIAGLREPDKAYLDVGSVSAPWGQDYFLETFGIGLWAEVLKIYRPEIGRSLARSISAGLQALSEYDPIHPSLWLDGKEIEGEYVLVEALNTNAFGPRIKAAPQADPSDGFFDLVFLQADQRENLIRYILAMLNEELLEMPGFELQRGRELRITWNGFPVHIDAEVRPRQAETPEGQTPAPGASEPGRGRTDQQIVVQMLHRAVELWVPHPSAESEAERSFHIPEAEQIILDKMRQINHDISSGPAGIR
jgi:diacylglycerol kinase (ATP)